MHVVAVIMAGGKGTRFGKDIEKPMAQFMGEPLIRRVIDATKESEKIAETIVAVTAINPNTAKEAAKASVKVIETDGQGYHEDLQQAIQKANLKCPVLIVSADLPLLTGKFLDEIIMKYEEAGKPALTVLIPEEAFREHNISAASPFEYDGKMYAVSGINIIDGQRILEEQEQEVVFSRRPEAVFTVNSKKDLETARNFLQQTKQNK